MREVWTIILVLPSEYRPARVILSKVSDSIRANFDVVYMKFNDPVDTPVPFTANVKHFRHLVSLCWKQRVAVKEGTMTVDTTTMYQYDQFEDQLRETFLYFLSYDTMGAGTLKKQELRKFFTALNLTEGMPTETADALMESIFAGEEKEELGFQDYVKYHNQVVDKRAESGLAPIDLLKVTSAMIAKASKQDEDQAPSVGGSTVVPGSLAKEVGVQAIGEVSSVHKLVHIFTKADVKQQGKVPMQEILKSMQEFEFFQKGTSHSVMNAETLDNYPLKKVELRELVKLVHPLMMDSKTDLLIGKAKASMELSGTPSHLTEMRANLIAKVDATNLSDTVHERDEISGLFAMFDTDNDMVLSLEEFTAAVGDVYGEETTRAIFDLVDLDGSGGIDVHEFSTYWKGSSKFEYQIAAEFGEHLLGLIDGSMDIESSPVLTAILSE